MNCYIYIYFYIFLFYPYYIAPIKTTKLTEHSVKYSFRSISHCMATQDLFIKEIRLDLLNYLSCLSLFAVSLYIFSHIIVNGFDYAEKNKAKSIISLTLSVIIRQIVVSYTIHYVTIRINT